MIKIINLKDKQEFLDDVVNCIWKQWGTETNQNFYKSLIQSIINNETEDIPQAYIAIDEYEFIGVITLLRSDLKSRQDLFPWLACLYVIEKERGKGIGRLLEKYCEDRAKEIGYSKLFLITELENYYEKTGWKFIGKEPTIPGDMIKVYERNL